MKIKNFFHDLVATIKNISKQFKTGDLVQVALDNVSLNFRDNEFVTSMSSKHFIYRI